MTTTVAPARPSWCTRCQHPAPVGVCPLCGCPDVTTVRPEHGWGDPAQTKHHGTPVRVLHELLIQPTHTLEDR